MRRGERKDSRRCLGSSVSEATIDGEGVMARLSILKVANSAIAGFLVAALLTFAGFLVVNHRIMLGPTDTDEVQAWT
jgi:hypothetical protein